MPPIEPSADARQAALAIRQMYLAFLETGFTDQQAMFMLGTMMANNQNGQQ